MILRAWSGPAAFYLALVGPSSVGAAELLLRGNQHQPRSLRRNGNRGRPGRGNGKGKGNGNGRGGGNGKGNFQKLGASGCTILEKVNLCEVEVDDSAERCHGSHMTREFACEDLETGAIYDIDNDMPALAQGGMNSAMGGWNDAFAFDDEDSKANLLVSGMDIFKGDANLDLRTGRISFVSGRFGRSDNQRGRGKGRQGRRLQQTGNRTVIALNVISSEGTTTGYDSVHLADSVFGALIGGPDPVNLASQYSACSHNQLNFAPQPDSTSSTPDAVSDLQDGVATVYSTVSTSPGGGTMRNDATRKLSDAHGSRGGAEYVMVCLPQGSMSGVAYAYLNHWLSVYQGNACTKPNIQMHEVGHNLDLSHSSEGDKEYGDGSGVMGISSGADDARSCFNGPKTYKLGWYADRHVEITAGVDSFNGRLYGFTQWAATTPSDKMIIRINDPSCSVCDWYISFNHGAGFNINTGEGKNRVQIHTKSSTPSKRAKSYVVAKLAAQSSYREALNGNIVEVAVGEINADEGWAQVSVGAFTDAPTASSVPTMAPATGSYYLGCGSTAGGCSGQTQEADVSERHELRCCSTTSLQGWNQYTAGCWGLSEFGSEGCIHGINFNEGRKKCLDAGGDLCTLAQLQNNCSRGSGCSHDQDFIWSLDKVPEPTPPPTNAATPPPPTPPPTNLPTNQPTNQPTNGATPPPTPPPTNTLTNPPTNPPTNVATPPSTPPPTNTPTNPPSNPPTNGPTNGDTHFNVVCGSTEGTCSNNPVREAERTELHEVRCCSDSNLGGGWVLNPNCNVWGESQVLGVCRKDQTYDQAVAHCASMSARLCTESELLGDCTKGTGCYHDSALNWSSTAVVLSTMAPTGTPLEGRAWLACGYSGSYACKTPVAMAAVEETHKVRCCADSFIGDGWVKKEGCDVWGESEIGGQCKDAETHQSAAGLCANAGARLCTKDEMTSDCTAGTGCGFDSGMIWTSTPVPPCSDDASCDDGNSCTIDTCSENSGLCENTLAPGCDKEVVGGYLHGSWSGPRVQQANASELHDVRCCSDTSRSGWIKRRNCAVWGESNLPMCNTDKTFAQANDICTGQNARLCTRDEIIADCTRGSGCGFDDTHVWVSTETHGGVGAATIGATPATTTPDSVWDDIITTESPLTKTSFSYDNIGAPRLDGNMEAPHRI